MKKELILKTFRNSTFAAVYIFLVSQILRNGEKLFSGKDNMLMPFVFLLLFSFSAAVVGGLVFGQSVILLSENKKTEAIKAVFYSIGLLGIYTVLGLLVLFFAK